MCRLAADHAAERDKPVETLARSPGDADRRRDLERSGDRDELVGGADRGERTLSAPPQLGCDVGVIGRLHDEDMGRSCHGVCPRSLAT